MIATPLRPKKRQAREQMLAYVGLTSALGTLVDPRLDSGPHGTNCRMTLVPGRIIVAPNRLARLSGLEPQEYGWPAVAVVDAETRFGGAMSTLAIDLSGVMGLLHVELDLADLRWALQQNGFQVVPIPHVPCARPWVQEELQPLLPVSIFATD